MNSDDLVTGGFAQRKQKRLDYLFDDDVLVTGAGGSIGQELVAQICASDPTRMILVDQNEHALYQVERRVRAISKCEVVPCLVDVRDQDELKRTFEREKPDWVFHAAALKHVPMMEENQNVLAAIRTNVLGTINVLEAAQEFGAKGFLLISTDKAVEPSSVMGATKRIAELCVISAAQDEKFGAMTLAMCRFGNVFGSSGSVVPLFEEQIAAGGPVTVTDRRMTRYLMTVREAVGLVLSALESETALKSTGGIYVFQMGDPVNVWKLAQDMIRMKGLRPYVDIDIVEVGIRPGEKLVEKLFRDDEIPQFVGPDGANRVDTSKFAVDAALKMIERFQTADMEELRRDLIRLANG